MIIIKFFECLYNKVKFELKGQIKWQNEKTIEYNILDSLRINSLRISWKSGFKETLTMK
jgi:hypothetical protein